MRRLLMPGLAVFMMMAVLGGNIAIAEEAKLLFAPAKITATEGETIKVVVRVEDVEGLFGTAMTVPFDKNFLAFLKTEEGDFLRQDEKGTVTMASVVPYTSCTINNSDFECLLIGYARMGSVGEVSGSGDLMTLVFRALKKGETELVFIEEALKKINGEISFSKNIAKIKIE